MMCKHPYIKDRSGMSLLSKHPENRGNATPFGCGRCLPCKINKAREWTNRLMLEASCYSENIFLTLTYSEDNIPNPPDVLPREIQLFLKRLRKYVQPDKLRYFAVGEYGDKSWRPHYHLAIFNYSPLGEKNIMQAWSNKKGQIGHILIGDLNKDSARYISGYCIKKLTNNNDTYTREVLNGRKPEFSRSSTQTGGIGVCAIDAIAAALRKKKYFNHNKIKLIRACAIGRAKLPLGRYLTARLASNLDMGLQECKELWLYQERMKIDHLDSPGTYRESLASTSKAQINAMEKKFKIYNHERNTL